MKKKNFSSYLSEGFIQPKFPIPRTIHLPTSDTIDDDNEDKIEPFKKTKKEEEEPTVEERVEIMPSLVDHQIYLKRLEETGRHNDPVYKNLPSMTQVLSYIETLKTKPNSFKLAQQEIINSKGLKFPHIPILTREFIIGYLRSPLKGEHACVNTPCESELLGGFRCIILNSDKDNQWCYLCHLNYTNKLFLESKNRKVDNERLYQIQYFGVVVDIPGEYRLEKCLQAEGHVRGLFVPFPQYNRNNYKKIDLPNNGCKAWIESDVMVFRLSPTM